MILVSAARQFLPQVKQANGGSPAGGKPVGVERPAAGFVEVGLEIEDKYFNSKELSFLGGPRTFPVAGGVGVGVAAGISEESLGVLRASC